MRILVYPHDLNMGGSQLNAIQIAARIQRMGHPTVIYGRPGTLNKTISDYGLEFIESPAPSHRPTPSIIRHLRRVIDEHEIDIVHGYEWPPALEAYVAVKGRTTVALGTVLSMSVAPFIPRSMPLVVGTEQIAAYERLRGRKNLHVLEPPVDLDTDGPEHVGSGDEFRRGLGIPGDVSMVVMVTRLAHELKLEGILTAIRTVAAMSEDHALHLVIVGDGPARAEVERAAEWANSLGDDPVVTLTGELTDPRPAYAAADVVLGMGSSALRGMAYSKPLIVQGENGFWKMLTPATLNEFLWTGWYGYGAGETSSLGRGLFDLLHDSDLRRDLGQLARRTIENHYALDRLAVCQKSVYEHVASRGMVATPLGEDFMTAARWARYIAGERWQWLHGRGMRDDANARPVASQLLTCIPPLGAPQNPFAIVWFARNAWDEAGRRERETVHALLHHRSVLWVDSPTAPSGKRRLRAETHPLGPGLVRVIPVTTRGLPRTFSDKLTRHFRARGAVYALSAWDRQVETVWDGAGGREALMGSRPLGSASDDRLVRELKACHRTECRQTGAQARCWSARL